MAKSQTQPVTGYPPLGLNKFDRIAASLRALASAVPLAGGVLAEIVTEIVPEQRIDRIERYLRLLAEEMEQRQAARALRVVYAEDATANRMKEPKNIDLIEDGAHLAARALSSERMRYIVHCVANGIEAEDRAKIHHKRILSLIGQLDDEEILILDAFGSNDPQKFDRVRPEPAHMNSPPAVIESNAIYDAAISKLERLSLIDFRSQVKEFTDRVGSRTEKIVVPEIDAWGQRRGHRHITHLGRLVLRSIGLAKGENVDV